MSNKQTLTAAACRAADEGLLCDVSLSDCFIQLAAASALDIWGFCWPTGGSFWEAIAAVTLLVGAGSAGFGVAAEGSGEVGAGVTEILG